MKTALALCALFSAVAAFGAAPRGFKSLFNGKDLTGWRGGTTYDHRKLLSLPPAEREAQVAKWTKNMTELDPKTGLPHWRVENGILINDGTGDYATTEKDYGNFELRLEYKTVAGADSGIYLRGAPQVQIWDYTNPDPRGLGYQKGSGGLWNNDKGAPGKDPLVLADKPFGEWNTFRILMVGARVSVWLNDQLVVDHALMENYYDKIDKKLPVEKRRPIPARGPIQLQTHGGETQWRNIYIRELDSAEACEILAKRGAEGFKAVEMKRSLDGWNGAKDIVRPSRNDVAILAKKEGELFLDRKLKDFAVRMLFRASPGAQSGVVMGVPDGDAGALLELPAGSVDYADYLHSKNDWNFQEIRVSDGNVVLELNGTPVLQRKLMESSDGLAFGFSAKGDQVEFRQLQLRAQ